MGCFKLNHDVNDDFLCMMINPVHLLISFLSVDAKNSVLKLISHMIIYNIAYMYNIHKGRPRAGFSAEENTVS